MTTYLCLTYMLSQHRVIHTFSLLHQEYGVWISSQIDIRCRSAVKWCCAKSEFTCFSVYERVCGRKKNQPPSSWDSDLNLVNFCFWKALHQNCITRRNERFISRSMLCFHSASYPINVLCQHSVINYYSQNPVWLIVLFDPLQSFGDLAASSYCSIRVARNTGLKIPQRCNYYKHNF